MSIEPGWAMGFRSPLGVECPHILPARGLRPTVLLNIGPFKGPFCTVASAEWLLFGGNE